MGEQMRLWHPWTFDPAMNTKWQVQGFDGRGKPTTSPVFVASRTQEGAVRAGKYWMRIVGIKRRGHIVAKRYYPERDPAFHLFIKREVTP